MFCCLIWCIHIHDTILRPLDNEIETEQNLKRTLCNGMMDSYPQDKKRKAALKGGERDASGPKKRENKKKKTENSKTLMKLRFVFTFALVSFVKEKKT